MVASVCLSAVRASTRSFCWMTFTSRVLNTSPAIDGAAMSSGRPDIADRSSSGSSSRIAVMSEAETTTTG